MDRSRSDPEKNTRLLNREGEPAELLDGRSDGGSSTSTLLDNMESEPKMSKLDIEEGPEASTASAQAALRSNRVKMTFWMVVNTLATIGIVSLPFAYDRNAAGEAWDSAASVLATDSQIITSLCIRYS